jgi:hypothetical protein
VGAKKRQTMGKIIRERERAEKRALKKEKKDEKKAMAVAQKEAEALGLPWPPVEHGGEAELDAEGEVFVGELGENGQTESVPVAAEAEERPATSSPS